MSTYSISQELINSARRIGDVTVAALLQRMRREGVEIAGLGTANLPLLSLLPLLGISKITVRDRRPPPPDVLARLSLLGANLRTGAGYLDDMEGVVFRTPSLRPDAPGLIHARRRGANVISEIALFLALCPASIYAVTGSDGKTTTATMAAAMLTAAGRHVHLGGNIGTPLLSLIPEIQSGDAVVVELSSFQLSDLDPPEGRVAITNLTENHLDWHVNMTEYVSAKAHILGRGTAVLSADCPYTAALAKGQDALLFSTNGMRAANAPAVFSEGGTVLYDDGSIHRLFPESAVRLPGRYQLANAMAAAGLTLPDAPADAMEQALAEFGGVRHRCEYLGTFRGVRCYDSSIDTTPARTVATLSAFAEKPVLLLGGRGKNLSFAPLADCVARSASGAVLFGEEAEAIATLLALANPSLPLLAAPDFDTAVRMGHTMAGDGGILLLSPACASFDLFKDYKERGDRFAALCRRL